MDKVTLASGRQFDCDYFNFFEPANEINISVVGDSLIEVASVFSDSAQTKQIWFGKEYFSSFTKLKAIIPGSGTIRVVLGKE